MGLNLFEKGKSKETFVDSFVKELGKYLKDLTNEKNNMKEDIKDKNPILEEYDIFEKKKIFLDNKSKNGNPLAWVIDEDSICISEDGDGGATSIDDIKLPKERNVGEVYEKIRDKYILNKGLTNQIKNLYRK